MGKAEDDFQAFPNRRQDKDRPYGDAVANDCWEETERLSDGIGGLLHREENPWRSLYRCLQACPLWNQDGQRCGDEAFAAEMFHITALLHFTHAIHSLWKLQNQHLSKKLYKLAAQEAITGAITSLYSCLDIHCHLIFCMQFDELCCKNWLRESWNGKSRRGRKVKTIKMRDFFANGKRHNDKEKLGPWQLAKRKDLQRTRELRDILRNRVVHSCYQYVVPKKDPRGLYLLNPTLTLEKLVEVRRRAVENKHKENGKTGWDFVDAEVFYRPDGNWLDVRDLLRELLVETLTFVEACTGWLKAKWR